MSRIFQALQKAGKGGDFHWPLTPGGLSSQSAAAGGGEANPDPASGLAEGAGASQASPGGLGSRIRTLPLQLLPGAPVFAFSGGRSHAGERYRMIRTKIIQHPSQPKLILISSAGPRDGKTTNSVNIAGILSLKNDVNVLLVDGDFRRSTMSSLLGLPASPGLAEVLAGECSLEEALVRVEQFPNLYVLPVGKAAHNPTELLDSPNWRAACEMFRMQFKYTIVDAPPIGSVADYDLIQVACDGVIVVLRPDHTDRTLGLKALETVTDKRLIGVVMNCAPEWFLWKTNDYYYYPDREQ